MTKCIWIAVASNSVFLLLMGQRKIEITIVENANITICLLFKSKKALYHRKGQRKRRQNYGELLEALGISTRHMSPSESKQVLGCPASNPSGWRLITSASNAICTWNSQLPASLGHLHLGRVEKEQGKVEPPILPGIRDLGNCHVCRGSLLAPRKEASLFI